MMDSEELVCPIKRVDAILISMIISRKNCKDKFVVLIALSAQVASFSLGGMCACVCAYVRLCLYVCMHMCVPQYKVQETLVRIIQVTPEIIYIIVISLGDLLVVG